MTFECFTVETRDHIAHIRFNRPQKANSMIPAFWRELPQAVNAISDDGAARVIVISAEGKHFSAGMDLSVFMGGAFDPDRDNMQLAAEAFLHKVRALQETFSCLERARQPVLAAIQGGAIGAGVDLATACDCRYASADAFFCVQETALGMTADVGTFPRLVKIIPEGMARQMAFTAERVSAARAREIGLVNEVYPDAESLLAGVMDIARQIAAHSPLAVAGSKAVINHARDHSTADGLSFVGLWNAAMLRPEDIREAHMARLEKRAPEFAPLRRASGAV
jgi:enoyl-CoA hydratase